MTFALKLRSFVTVMAAVTYPVVNGVSLKKAVVQNSISPAPVDIDEALYYEARGRYGHAVWQRLLVVYDSNGAERKRTLSEWLNAAGDTDSDFELEFEEVGNCPEKSGKFLRKLDAKCKQGSLFLSKTGIRFEKYKNGYLDGHTRFMDPRVGFAGNTLSWADVDEIVRVEFSKKSTTISLKTKSPFKWSAKTTSNSRNLKFANAIGDSSNMNYFFEVFRLFKEDPNFVQNLQIALAQKRKTLEEQLQQALRQHQKTPRQVIVPALM